MDTVDQRFFSLNSNELLALNLLLTAALSNGLDANQLNVLGNFICALGQNMLVIQARIGALPGQARYTLQGEQVCPSACPASSSAASLENELQKCQERLTALENLLQKQSGAKETQDQPDQHRDADANQGDR